MQVFILNIKKKNGNAENLKKYQKSQNYFTRDLRCKSWCVKYKTQLGAMETNKNKKS